jgi:nicotinamide riboside transporter PnuC
MLLTYVFWVVVLFSSLYDIYFLVDPVVFALIYVWSKKKPFQTIRLVFGISMQSKIYSI